MRRIRRFLIFLMVIWMVSLAVSLLLVAITKEFGFKGWMLFVTGAFAVVSAYFACDMKRLSIIRRLSQWLVEG